MGLGLQILYKFLFTVDKTYMNLKSRKIHNKQSYIKLQFISRRLDEIAEKEAPVLYLLH